SFTKRLELEWQSACRQDQDLLKSTYCVSMWKMGCLSGAVHWTPVQALVWSSKQTARGESLSFTARTRISTSRPRRCPETPRQPANC
ncbi:hypothetical protein F2P79_026050, partial [Pimephales promelas]